MTKHRFKQFAWALFIYTLLVILWGAWVRISHSGDGCGDTWPLCNGQLIPEAQRGKTWVEYAHRLMSGIYGFVVIYFWWVTRKLYPIGHWTRKAGLATLIFMITEALLGAKLVLFGLVTTNDTPYRAFVMALHQINSFILTGSITLAAVAASYEEITVPRPPSTRKYQLLPWLIVIIGITGAWASLSNSLFPTDSLLEGLRADFAPDSHFLVKLRGLHPLIALIGGGSLCLYFWIYSQSSEHRGLKKSSLAMSATLGVGILFGIATLLLHAPVWMKIVHLSLAHIMWASLLSWIFYYRQKAKA